MNGFRDYLWALLPRPYKVFDGASDQREPPETKKWVKALGGELDATQEGIYRLRRLWGLLTTAGELLDVIGYDRNMPRWDDEPDEEYRLRLMAAFDWFSLGGTVPGIRKILHRLGFPNVKVTERITPERWAEFSVEMKLTDGLLTEPRIGRIRRSIEEIKAAHTILAKLTIQIEDTPPFPYTHGTATFWGGRQGIGLPRPEVRETHLAAGIATISGGRRRIGLHRPTLRPTPLFSGIATTQAVCITIRPIPGDVPDINRPVRMRECAGIATFTTGAVRVGVRHLRVPVHENRCAIYTMQSQHIVIGPAAGQIGG